MDDPLGRIEYIHNAEFENSIRSMIDNLNPLDNYLVITMREMIYRKFNTIGKKDLVQNVKKLNIGKRSYDFEKRREMLVKWAKVMKCKWLEYEKLRNFVLQALGDETMLPTPLNIKDFAMVSYDMVNEEELLVTINIMSQRVSERFAREIEMMEAYGEIYKILFLCFQFISDQFSYYFLKTQYNDLLKDFAIEDDHAFEKVCVAFQDKIDFTDQIKFSHPSFSEALPFILLDTNGIPTRINVKIFSRVLFKLAENKEAADDVARAVSQYFDKLPENVRNELLRKLERENSRENANGTNTYG